MSNDRKGLWLMFVSYAAGWIVGHQWGIAGFTAALALMCIAGGISGSIKD